MTLQIDQFRAVVAGGFQKPNKYRLLIPVPSIFAQMPEYGTLYNTDRYLSFYCNSLDFVGVNLQTVPITRYGYGSAQEYGYSAAFSNIMATFYVDSDALNMWFFQKWCRVVNNFNMEGTIAGSDSLNVQPFENYYKDDYAVDMYVTLLSQLDEDVGTWVMREAFPKSIAETKLAWDVVNDIMRVTVIFSYADWYLLNSQESRLIGGIVNNTGPGGSSDAISQAALQDLGINPAP